MANRTFGWIQNPASFDTLRNVVALFYPSSPFNIEMRETRLPFLIETGLADDVSLIEKFISVLSNDNIIIDFATLKGKGPNNQLRSLAKCSGIVQAAIDAQGFKEVIFRGEKRRIKKPYTDDWTADGYLRWAISIGLLSYNRVNDTCQITALGKRYVDAENEDDSNEILGEALLSYPPACRILGLLKGGQSWTKFELGSKLGFTGEPGFTSYPQNVWAFSYATEPENRKALRSDAEGSSDKYARMIAGWLVNIGWAIKTKKNVYVRMGDFSYNCDIDAFVITPKGLKNYNHTTGRSSLAQIPKIVFSEMLATKAPNKNYLRLRRSIIIKFLNGNVYKSIDEIKQHLANKGFDETISSIKDDIEGLINIGLNFSQSNGKYRIDDTILCLDYSNQQNAIPVSDDVSQIKERIRLRLHNLDHKYLYLIDCAFNGKENLNFEIATIDLLTNGLGLDGIHLGGPNRPDGIISYKNKGVIIDNKAYENGYSLPKNQEDEMVRYITDNIVRDEKVNSSCWWKNFSPNIIKFNYTFVSSIFTGNIEDRLNNIKQRTDRNGAVINAENLLYFADAIKGGEKSLDEFMSKFNENKEIIFHNGQSLLSQS